jgi:hypothetical protein
VFFIIGIGNLIFTFFGVVESATSYGDSNLAYYVTLLYSAWAIGNFFNQKSIWSYFRGVLAYLFGTLTGSFLLFLVGALIDAYSKGG